MTRNEFEQLLSLALDAPQRADLRERIDAAVSTDPALAPIRDDWSRLNEAIKSSGAAELGRIDWTRFAARIEHAVAEIHHDPDVRLTHLLAKLPGVAGRVRWERLLARISAEVGRAAAQDRGIGRLWRRSGRVASLAAAAAAVALAVWLPQTRVPTAATASLLEVTVHPAEDEVVAGAEAFAQFTPLPPQEIPVLAQRPQEQIMYLKISSAPPRRPQYFDNGYY